MSKTAMCIRMLQILNTGHKYHVWELAQLLDTSPRNVIEYKKELNYLASLNNYEFYIRDIPGRYGGYQIEKQSIIPSLNLNKEEKKSLQEAIEYLSSRNDFMDKSNYQLAMGKIFSSLEFDKIGNSDNLTVINRFPLVMKQEEIQKRSDILKTAIVTKRTVEFSYFNQRNERKYRVFDPYDLFMYNNAWFVIGWQHNDGVNDIRWFKLNRIEDLKLTDNKFTVYSYYNKYNYIDEYGFKNNGEWYHIEFIAHGNYASLVKERIYGKNQVVEALDDNSTKVSVDMQNQESIRVFILGFGNNIDVLSPEWLKNDLIAIANTIKEKYEGR